MSFQFVKGILTVSFGRKTVLMLSSSGLNRFSIFGVVRAKYVHLLEKPCVKAAKAQCDWVMAIEESLFRSSIQVLVSITCQLLSLGISQICGFHCSQILLSAPFLASGASG